MLEFCPVCRARQLDESTCKRCGADLTILFKIALQARHCFEQSVTHAMAGEVEASLTAAAKSMRLKKEPLYGAWCAFLESRKTRITLDLVDGSRNQPDEHRRKGGLLGLIRSIFS